MPVILSQLAYGRGEPFPDAALERFKIWLRKIMFNSQNRKCDVMEHQGGSFTLKVRQGSEVVIGAGEVEVYAFRPMPEAATDPVEFYQSFFQEILGSLQHGCMIKDAIIATDYETDYLRKFRPSLLDKGICEQQRIIFVIFEPTVSDTTKSNILEKFALNSRQLQAEDVAAYMERLAAPESPLSGKKTPQYAVSQVMNGKQIRMYPGKKVQGAMSLTTLPATVEPDYNLILAPSIARGTVITTTFRPREGLREMFRKALNGFFRTAGLDKVSRTEKEEAEDQADLEDRNDKVELHLYQSLLMYDTPESLHRRMLSLQNVRTLQSLPDALTPMYRADEGFIEESFRAALPSAWAYLPQRLHDVNSRTEASRYLPIEAPLQRWTSPLVLRTIRNTPYYIDIQSISDKVLVVIVGDTGTGKSTLLALNNKALLHLEEQNGIGVGFISIDVGGTNSWVKDESGVLSFDLAEEDSEGEPVPCPVYPLHCVLDPDKKKHNAEELGLAKQYLGKLMKFKTHVAIAQEAIEAAILKMTAENTEYRLSTFLACFESEFDRYMADGKVSEAMRFEWIEAISIMRNYCKGGVYGKIYDPETTPRRNLDGVTRLYFNIDLKHDRIKDLSSFHLQLGYLIGYSLCLRYSSTSGQYRLMHFYVDEFKKQSEYIDSEEILELKNQSRKNGFIPFVCIQSLKHLLMERLDPEKRKEIFEGIRELWVGQVDFNEDRSKWATILGYEEFERGSRPTGKLLHLKRSIDFNTKIYEQRKKVEKIPDPTDIEREAAKQYTICYISQTREIVNLFVDVETVFAWEFTTHAAAREIRALVMKELQITKREAARILTRLHPRLPTAKLSYGEQEKLLESVRKEVP
jgi:energy-coupling factor transporter ATP-binding protein EcfA2